MSTTHQICLISADTLRALRHDGQYLNSLGQPLSMTFLLSYLDDAKNAIRLGAINLEEQPEGVQKTTLEVI